MKYERPPNKSAPVKPGAGKPRLGPPGPPGGGRPPIRPEKPVKIQITLGKVVITVEGPALEVKAFIEWIRNQQAPPTGSDAVIASLKLVFGPEVPTRRK